MGAFIENRDFQRRPLGDFYKANLNRLAFFIYMIFQSKFFKPIIQIHFFISRYDLFE